jgi:ribonuclease D
VTLRVIVSQDEFDSLVRTWQSCSRIALDTEFHREKSYFARLALLQIADPNGVHLIDPTKVDIGSLASLYEATTFVLHASQQDLEVLFRATGQVPQTVIDTQLIAGFIGHSTPSLSNLVQAIIGVSLPKGDRLTDWFARPLTDDQMKYAASDVEYLLHLAEHLEAELKSRNRLEWAREACAELSTRRYEPITPTDAWMRLKDVKTLNGQARAAAQALCTWREERAQRDDLPPRIVLSDLAVLAVAQRRPSRIEDLTNVRGTDPRSMKGKIGAEIIEVISRAPEDPMPYPATDFDENDRKLRPAITLSTAWISELGRREKIDPTLLATKADVVAFLRGVPSRLDTGWRRDVVGQDLADLLAGRAALNFDGQGRLKLLTVDPPL